MPLECLLCITPVQFVRQCELMKIEDILPFFPENTQIDNFKEVFIAQISSRVERKPILIYL